MLMYVGVSVRLGLESVDPREPLRSPKSMGSAHWAESLVPHEQALRQHLKAIGWTHQRTTAVYIRL